jgi:hypothetical protein
MPIDVSAGFNNGLYVIDAVAVGCSLTFDRPG